LDDFFTMLGPLRYRHIRYVCSDMWKGYLKVVAQRLPDAVHILDRFHIVANLNKALDKVRAAEAKKLSAIGDSETLKKTRWCILKRPKNLTTKQRGRLKELLSYNLKTVRAYLLSQEFQFFWTYKSSTWAERFLDSWCRTVMRSRIEPLKGFARQMRHHKPLLLNWFKTKKQFSSGAVEAMNNNAKLAIRKAYGFRSFNALEIALFHRLGNLPEPPIANRFW
jgi:transposase